MINMIIQSHKAFICNIAIIFTVNIGFTDPEISIQFAIYKEWIIIFILAYIHIVTEQRFFISIVFKLVDGKMVLIEIAPGIDLQKDVLDQMEYEPVISDDLKTMDAAIFSKDRMTSINPVIFKNFQQGEDKTRETA